MPSKKIWEIIGRTGVGKTCVGWRLNEVDSPMRNQHAKQPSGPAYTTVRYAPFRGRIYTCILFLEKHIYFNGHLALGTRVHIQPTAIISFRVTLHVFHM